jgi:hypothetical protein
MLLDPPSMDMRLGEILRTMAKTAALCGALGLLLHGAIAMLAERADGPWLIGLALAAPMAALLAHLVIEALRSGHVPMRGGAVLRREQPLAFWFSVAWFGAAGLSLGAIALWCAVQMAGAG